MAITSISTTVAKCTARLLLLQFEVCTSLAADCEPLREALCEALCEEICDPARDGVNAGNLASFDIEPTPPSLPLRSLQ